MIDEQHIKSEIDWILERVELIDLLIKNYKRQLALLRKQKIDMEEELSRCRQLLLTNGGEK